MASPRFAPSGIIPAGVVIASPFAAGGAGWWLDGARGATLGGVAGVVVVAIAAWMWTRPRLSRLEGNVAVEMKPGVASASDARTRTAVMDGGTRAGVVPAGRSARGHRDRDL
jgi:hypothetical protein